jgi:hypothetical protein
MMRLFLLAVCGVVGLSTVTSSGGPDPAGVDNVVAFARLYGVVRYFYPGDAATSLDWNGFAVLGASRVRPARDAAALESALEALFLPLGPGIEIGSTLSPAPALGEPDATLVAWRYLGAGIGHRRPGIVRAVRTGRPTGALPASRDIDPPAADLPVPVAGDHVDVELASGLRARVALALADDAARRPDSADLGPLIAASAQMLPARDGDVDANLADVVVAWNVFRHFYPYWAELTRDPAVDWDAQLAVHLQAALGATSRAQQHDVLQALVAAAHDGHGDVRDPAAAATRGALPIQARPIDGRVVVTATSTPAVPVGAVITAVGGQAAGPWLEARLRRLSGTTQWKAERALRVIECERGTNVDVLFDDGRSRSAGLACGPRPSPTLTELRPAPLAELSPALWYVDLTRTTAADVEASLPRLADARGVIFDVRGYPTDAGAAILPHLLAAPERDRWMHLDRITGPFGRVDGTAAFGWDLQPKAPAIAGRRVFLTDGRAISYAESVMGYVADRGLATIVGAPTAGTNGNVASFDVPSGRQITFTGMRVTRHDGRSRRHLIGIAPDVPLTPTIDGIRRGRDELLEAAVAVIDGRQRVPPTPSVAPLKIRHRSP